MKSQYHKTKDGKIIAISDLKDSHLKNIVSFIERRAKEGVQVVTGCGGSSAEDMWCDVDYYYGWKAKKLLNYNSYINEIKKRNI